MCLERDWAIFFKKKYCKVAWHATALVYCCVAVVLGTWVQ
jgi:hypothetical protein